MTYDNYYCFDEVRTLSDATEVRVRRAVDDATWKAVGPDSYNAVSVGVAFDDDYVLSGDGVAFSVA